jgi:hypothetical protein
METRNNRRMAVGPPVAGPMAPGPLVATTPKGSTIERTGPNRYRICDAGRHCREVDGLWEAQQLVRRAEVRHRALDQLT